MTRTQIFAAAAAVCSIILVAASASFREARHESPRPSPRNDLSRNDSSQDDFDARFMSSRKGDRLPLSASLPLAAANARGEVAASVTSKPEQPLQLATEDDLRQAEEEHHRHRDICARGRIWFTIENHRYWRCKR